MYFAWDRRQTFLDGPQTNRDYFEIDHVTYQALPLDAQEWWKGIGINSSVFRAKSQDSDEGADFVVKVCNYGEEVEAPFLVARRERFRREIYAMRMARDSGKGHLVISLLGDGLIETADKRMQRCFLMEAADHTLEDHLSGEQEFSLQQRFVLCADLLRAVNALHEIGIYHRDLKPENILFAGNQWKIGDLGLVGFRDEDAELDSREKIGPLRWMSPEAFNKAYCLQRPDNGFIDRILDDRSDVYQLGKLWWYIMQGDIPNGCLRSKDLVHGCPNMYSIFLKPMLRYQRLERPTLAQLEGNLEPLMRTFAAA